MTERDCRLNSQIQASNHQPFQAQWLLCVPAGFMLKKTLHSAQRLYLCPSYDSLNEAISPSGINRLNF